MKDILGSPTIIDLAALIIEKMIAERFEEEESISTQKIERIPEQESYELSNAQRRLWILSQLEEDQIAYNMPAAIRLKGQLNEGALERAINLIFERHEILRTNFKEERQIIQPKIDFKLSIRDLSLIHISEPTRPY